MRHLAQRADALRQVYPRAAETEAIVGVTILVTSLAMNYVHRGTYFPETQPPPALPATSPPPSTASPESAAKEAEEGDSDSGETNGNPRKKSSAVTPPAS
jgi:hypothetical protein